MAGCTVPRMSDEYVHLGHAPTPPTGGGRRRLWPWIVGGLATLLLVTGGAVALTIVVMSKREPAAPQAASTLTVIGQMRLDRGGFAWNRDPADCWGYQGYEDIRQGASVTVTDSAGKVVALGALKPGKPVVISDRATNCLLRFEISNVPAGLEFYGIEVAHRGVVRFSEKDLVSSMGVTLSLGS